MDGALPHSLDLAGTWSLQSADGSYACDYAVPGDVHSALMAAGIIADPYQGKNEFACRWVADDEWVAVKTFDLQAIEAGEYYLDIDYLDTIATVKVNDEVVLQSENCFRRYRPNVTDALKVGTNTVAVTLHSNTKAANGKQAAQPFYIPYSVSNNPIPNGNMLRKPQCHFGWDWNLAVVPFGLCGRFELQHVASARIDSVQALQFHNADGSVDVQFDVTLHGSGNFKTEVSVNFVGETKSVHVTGSGFCYETVRFHLRQPELWWPAGQGAQNLYRVEVRCGAQLERRNIGIRRLELITDKDAVGNRFAFKVNGREIFCKGANWIPADALPLNATPERTRRLLQAAVDANMNMIRVWGGGYYEKDFFYDICDELGLLVWQDFMFACSLYPSTPEFLMEVRAEAHYQVTRIGHHACLAVWCGDNELLGALTWFEESRKNRDRYLVNYDRLNRTLEETVRAADTSAIWWPSSPSPGILDFGDTWHDDSKGDMHFWSVWHEGRDFEHYRDVKPRFCSEFGFQSFPSLRLIKDFATSAEDLNIASSVMEHHQRNKGGNARIAETMFRNFRFPEGFGNFVYLSQIQHGLAMRMAIEYWRSLKPHCMGTLYWQLNDTWPVASWSGLDHGGSWKAMHYMARRFYAPVLPVIIPEKDGGYSVHGLNDTSSSQDIEVTITAIDKQSSAQGAFKLSGLLSPDSATKLGHINAEQVKDIDILNYEWRSNLGEGRNHLALVPYKHIALQNPQLQTATKIKNDTLEIKVSALKAAYYVALETDVAGHFSDNAFDLRGSESATITFTPDSSADLTHARDTLIVRDLYSSSHLTSVH